MLQIFFIILFRISLKIPSLCSLLFLNFLHYAYIYSFYYAPCIILQVIY